MGFFSDLFGGSTPQENSLEVQSQSLSNLLQADFQQNYGEQQSLMQSLRQSLSPILAAGPDQMGYSPQLMAALNTEAINQTGAAARNAEQFAATKSAGQGGGGSTGLTSGIQQQIAGSIASTETGNLANEQLGITKASEAQGNANWRTAEAGLNALTGQYNPGGYAGEANAANKTAFGEADTINQQDEAANQAAMGFGLKVLGGLAGGFGNLDTLGTSTAGEQVGNFFTGAFGS